MGFLHLKKKYIAFIIFNCVFLISCKSNLEVPNFSKIGSAIHCNLETSLLRINRNKFAFALQISLKDIQFEKFEYLSCRNDPLLSDDILFITKNADTIQPILTLVEKGYEASGDMIYLMQLPGKFSEKKMKRFQIINFLNGSDTLSIDIKKE